MTELPCFFQTFLLIFFFCVLEDACCNQLKYLNIIYKMDGIFVKKITVLN